MDGSQVCPLLAVQERQAYDEHYGQCAAEMGPIPAVEIAEVQLRNEPLSRANLLPQVRIYTYTQ